MPRRRPATTVPRIERDERGGGERRAQRIRDRTAERGDGGEVEQRVHQHAGQQGSGAQHRVAEHHPETDERERVEGVADLRDVTGEHGEDEPGCHDRDQAGCDAPVLGVAPVASAALGHDRADQHQHREAVDDLLVDAASTRPIASAKPPIFSEYWITANASAANATARNSRQASRLLRSSPSRRHPTSRRPARPRWGAWVRPAPRQVAEVHPPPRRDHVEDHRERGDRHDGVGQGPAGPPAPLPHQFDARRRVLARQFSHHEWESNHSP